jgi:AraC family transcriptional regulator of adaptative response / DNA-3-methyladenine glycosylase II
MQDIAVAAGYGSVRRFNDSFVKTYGRSPRELRRVGDNSRASGSESALTVELACSMPFDWQNLLAFFAARAIPGVESVDGGRYLRAMMIDGQPGAIELRQDAGSILLTMHGISTPNIFPVVQRCREMFDLDAPMQQRNPGVRVPGAWCGFELTVRAILGQQISVKAATTIAGRVAEAYGEPARNFGLSGLAHLFPAPERLARAQFKNVGITRSRAETLRRVAKAVVDGGLTFDHSQDPAAFRESLIAIPGIGEWTAQYVAMRALKNPDAFPAADLGLLRAFDEPGRQRLRPAQLEEMSQGWRPWRAYAALLLWSSAPGSGG